MTTDDDKLQAVVDDLEGTKVDLQYLLSLAGINS
jgi:hypothetical protein